MLGSKVFRDTVEGSKIIGTRAVSKTKPEGRAELVQDRNPPRTMSEVIAPIKHK